MDNILLITVLTIFVAAFVATLIRYRARDKCIKGFRDYFITAEFKDGKRIWGSLDVYHNGMELLYTAPHLDPDGTHYETSYILYQDQYAHLKMLKRFHDELTPENQQRRATEIRHTYQPNLARRTWRHLRNAFNLLRDAFSQAVTVFIGHVKKAGTSSFVSSQDAKIQDTAKNLIGATAAAYEPILEKYIGQRVVLETILDGNVTEYCGILKEYTDSFISLLNVLEQSEEQFHLLEKAQLDVNHNLDFNIEHAIDAQTGTASVSVSIRNLGSTPICVTRAEARDYERVIESELTPGATWKDTLSGIPLPAAEETAEEPENAQQNGNGADRTLPDVSVWIQASRDVDIVVPRTIAAVRHGAENRSRTEPPQAA
jgi:hypothetical protein